jgi:NAD(P)-dependent dehydrogenase (short-subunit alcohol dehydrogenase family)
MTKILLFGGKGEIGSFLRKSLKEKYEIISPKATECDLESEKDVENIIEKNKDIKIIINSALYRSELKPIEKTDYEFLTKYFKINLFSNYAIVKYAKKYLNEVKIILFSSIASKGMPYNSFYSSVKSGIESLIRASAFEFKKENKNMFITGIKLGPVKVSRENFNEILKIQHEKLQKELLQNTTLTETINKTEILKITEFLITNDIKSLNGEIITLSGAF